MDKLKNRISENLDDMEEKRLINIFEAFDTNKDGAIDFQEFQDFIE